MGQTKRVCEICQATIPDEWDNKHHYGTCPSCKRGTNFILKNEELQHIADEENQRQKHDWLLNKYAVLDKNDRSGVVHVNCIGLAKLVYNELGMHFKTIEDEATGKQEIYYYDNGYYHIGGENKIRKTVDIFLDDYSSIHRKNEVVDYIKNRNVVLREQLEPPVHLINLKNGIYNLEKECLEEHNPSFFFLNQIPVEYHKNAKCPRIKQFIQDVVYDEYIKVVQEIAGYLMYRHYKYHKAFLFYGGGRNGKSTLLNLFEDFIGHKNFTSNSLTTLLENRFATASLYGKLANFGGEISGKALNDTSQFKHLTGDDVIRAEKKFYGSFSFRNYAKLLFNTNHIPYSKYDKTLAYFQRWIVIVFPETFSPEDKKTDPDIGKKISTKKEMQGLLIWALEGLKRLLRQGKFSYTDDDDEESVGERYELLAKPEMRFIKDYIKLSEGEKMDSDKTYHRYLDWADRRNYPKLAKKVFSRSMKKYMRNKETGIECSIQSTTLDGKKTRVYTNVCWKEQPTDSLRLDSFDEEECPHEQEQNKKDSLHSKLQYIREFVEHDGELTYSWLKNEFSEGFINKLIESGQLVRNPDDTYEVI